MEDPVPTTTAHPDQPVRPLGTNRPPYGTRVFWPVTTWPLEVATGTVLDPSTPDVGHSPAGTTPVLYRGTVCHVDTARLRMLPTPVAPAA
jgi:hypothetical protein